MQLKDYFKDTQGTGILSTADTKGKVDSAIYGRPHFLKDGSLGFIMRNRLSYANIQENPQAAFLFIEEGPHYRGKRLILTKIREENDEAAIEKLVGPSRCPVLEPTDEGRSLVVFKLEEERPLIGS